AGQLEDRLQPASEDLEVGIEGEDPPGRPPLAVVLERLARHRDRLGPVGRPRGERKHQDLGPWAEESPEVALADAVEVRLMAVVGADGHAAAEVGRRADLAEEVVPAELALGMPGDPAQEQLALDVGGPAGLVEEGPRQPARTDLDRRA